MANQNIAELSRLANQPLKEQFKVIQDSVKMARSMKATKFAADCVNSTLNANDTDFVGIVDVRDGQIFRANSPRTMDNGSGSFTQPNTGVWSPNTNEDNTATNWDQGKTQNVRPGFLRGVGIMLNNAVTAAALEFLRQYVRVTFNPQQQDYPPFTVPIIELISSRLRQVSQVSQLAVAADAGINIMDVTHISKDDFYTFPKPIYIPVGGSLTMTVEVVPSNATITGVGVVTFQPYGIFDFPVK